MEGVWWGGGHHHTLLDVVRSGDQTTILSSVAVVIMVPQLGQSSLECCASSRSIALSAYTPVLYTATAIGWGEVGGGV